MRQNIMNILKHKEKAKLTEWANMHLWGTRDKSMLADWVRNE
jgi:hypothetical protein